MNQDDSADGFLKTHPALTDLTNRLVKDRCLSNLDNSSFQIGNGFVKTVENKGGDLQFAQQISHGCKNSSKGKCKHECIDNGKEKGLSFLKAKRLCSSQSRCREGESLQGNPVSGISRIFCKIKEASSLLGGNHHFSRGDAMMQGIVESCDGLKDGDVSSISVPTDFGQQPPMDGEECQDEEVRASADVTRCTIGSNLDSNALATLICTNNEKRLGGDNLASNKSIPIVSSRPSGSCITKSFELERCTGLKGDGAPDNNADIDLLKACLCPFCLKAAYIWSDLHYQDAKGQIAALKRSRKEVDVLVERSCRHGETDTSNQGNSILSKLELDLMERWRSLYLHVGDNLARESTQLQSTLLTLKELRESCKMDLELIHGMGSDR